MDLQEYLARMNSGEPVQGGGDMHRNIRQNNEHTKRHTRDLNNNNHTASANNNNISNTRRRNQTYHTSCRLGVPAQLVGVVCTARVPCV